MLMVILGAGASFDSAMYDQPHAVEILRPPLANDLFSDRELLAKVRRQYPPAQWPDSAATAARQSLA